MSKRINNSRTPIYRALKQHQLTLALTAGLAASLPASADQPTRSEWDCRPDKEGKGWICDEIEVKGKAYTRPQHRASVVAAEAAVTASQQDDGLAQSRNLDWVEQAEMTADQEALIASGCCGAYVEPSLSGADAELDPAKAKLLLDAEYTSGIGSVITMTGGVEVAQGYRRLRSDSAVVDRETRVADLEGNVQLREPGLLMQGDSAHLDTETQAAEINNAIFLFHEDNIRGTAAQLSRTTDNIYHAKDATYTSCPPTSNAWKLVTSELEIDGNEKVATARHVRLHVKDVPVIYIPWMRFPVGGERKSGLLYPNLEVGGNNGIDFALPYYFNLAPNYDATLTPRYIQERGSMLEGEFRHLSDWSFTTLSGTWLGDDKGGDPDTVNPILEDSTGKDRWLINVDHNGRVGRLSTKIDYTEVSDNLYFQDLGNATLEVNSQTYLRQMAQLGFNTDHWDINLKGEKFQTIYESFDRVEPYKQLPRLDANGFYTLADGLSLTLNNHVVTFDHTDDDNIGSGSDFSQDVNKTFITGSRARAEWGLEWDKQWGWGFFKPGIKAKFLAYELDDPVDGHTSDNPSIGVPVGYIDSGLFFERDTTLLTGFTQTFEPRLKLLYSEFEDQSDFPDFDTAEQTFSFSSLWRDDRFSGGDRIGDTKQASIGLSTRLVDDLSGTEWLRASIGQIFYFEDRKVSLNPLLTPEVIDNPLLLDTNGNGILDPGDDGISASNLERTEIELASLTNDESPIAADLMWRLSDNWRITTDAIWNTDQSRIDKGSFALRYNNNENTILNLGYRFTRKTALPTQDPNNPQPFEDQDIEQGNISTVVPIYGDWSFIGRWNYDFTNDRDLEIFAGVEYNSCCWRASIVARQWIDRDDLRFVQNEDLDENDGIFFQIQFKGLAGTSGKLDDILSDGIYGYKAAKN